MDHGILLGLCLKDFWSLGVELQVIWWRDSGIVQKSAVCLARGIPMFSCSTFRLTFLQESWSCRGALVWSGACCSYSTGRLGKLIKGLVDAATRVHSPTLWCLISESGPVAECGDHFLELLHQVLQIDWESWRTDSGKALIPLLNELNRPLPPPAENENKIGMRINTLRWIVLSVSVVSLAVKSLTERSPQWRWAQRNTWSEQCKCHNRSNSPPKDANTSQIMPTPHKKMRSGARQIGKLSWTICSWKWTYSSPCHQKHVTLKHQNRTLVIRLLLGVVGPFNKCN